MRWDRLASGDGLEGRLPDAMLSQVAIGRCVPQKAAPPCVVRGVQHRQPGRTSLLALLRLAVRRALRVGLTPLRLVLRPLAWRARCFLLSEIHPLLAKLNASQTNLLKQVQDLALNAAPNERGGAAVMRRPEAVQMQRKVHQFHAGSDMGDAITNAMLLIQRHLRGLGYVSDIYVEHIGVGLEAALQPLAALPMQDDHVLLVHHSMGHAGFAKIYASPARKILIYHNITPPDLLMHNRHLRDASELGRKQLLLWRDQVAVALADSAFNGVELRRLGFASVMEASLLFDLAEMGGKRCPTPQAAADSAVYTVLFVGRLVPSKGQMALIEAFAHFAALLAQQSGRAARLVLVGGEQQCAPGYKAALQALAGEHDLADQVLITGKISDAALEAWYRSADLYVSLSLHEGFGVPLVEAMTHGLAVLALRAGAVAETLGGHGGLLEDGAAITVAKKMLALAMDADKAAALVAAQSAQLARFHLTTHMAVLEQALSLAGLPSAVADSTRDIVRNTMLFWLNKEEDADHSVRYFADILTQTRPAQVMTDTGVRRWVDPSALSVVLCGENARLLSSDLHRLVLFDGPAQRIGPARAHQLNTQAGRVVVAHAAVAQALVSSGVHVPICVVPPQGRGRAWAEQIVERAVDDMLSPPARRLRLGWVAPWYSCRGITVQSRQLLAGFAQASTAPISMPVVFCEQARGEWCREFAPALLCHAMLHLLPTHKDIAALACAIGGEDPDVLMIQHDPALLAWENLLDLLHAPQLRQRCVVVHLHAAYQLPELDYTLCRRLCAALTQTSQVLVPYEQDRSLLADFGVHNSDYLPYGAHAGLSPRLPRVLENEDAPLIGCAGFLLPQLGLRALLQAVSLLRLRWPHLRLRLLTARHADPASDIEHRACVGLIRSLQLAEQVEWCTAFLPSEEVIEQLHGCDLVVLPSVSDGGDAGVAVRMAIASGAPTVIYHRPGWDDLGASVGRMSSATPQQIAHEVQHWLCSADQRLVLQQRAQHWLAEHAWEVVAGRLQGMLVGLHGARSSWPAADSLTPSS